VKSVLKKQSLLSYELPERIFACPYTPPPPPPAPPPPAPPKAENTIKLCKFSVGIFFLE